MAKSLKGSYKSAGAANRRRYSHISSGKPISIPVKKACALVRKNVNGTMRTVVRKGCRLTKSGARCDELVRLPETAYDRKKKITVDCK